MSDLLEYKGYHGTVGYSAEDKLLVGSVVGVQDSLNYHGQTLAELEASFRDCVDGYLEDCRLIGKDPDKEYKGSFNVRISPDLHRMADLAAKRNSISLNQLVANALREKLDPKPAMYVVSPYGSVSITEISSQVNTEEYIGAEAI